MGLFDFAEAKARVRQTVHDYMSVDAVYVDATYPAGIPLTVRWHDKINRFGNLDNMGWAERVEGIDRLIFNVPELTSSNVVLQRNAVVTIPAYNKSFLLELPEDDDGPVESVWIVKQQK